MTKMKKPIHESEVDAQVWYQGTDRELHGKALCDVGGVSRIGFGIVELSPGCDTQPAHYHKHEEEHLYVLEGTGTLHLGDATHRLTKGSYVNFPAGQEVAHYVSNDSKKPLKYIMAGERIEDDKVVYPEVQV
jgi:uncharacterized cupin superfamily protein